MQTARVLRRAIYTYGVVFTMAAGCSQSETGGLPAGVQANWRLTMDGSVFSGMALALDDAGNVYWGVSHVGESVPLTRRYGSPSDDKALSVMQIDPMGAVAWNVRYAVSPVTLPRAMMWHDNGSLLLLVDGEHRESGDARAGAGVYRRRPCILAIGEGGILESSAVVEVNEPARDFHARALTVTGNGTRVLGGVSSSRRRWPPEADQGFLHDVSGRSAMTESAVLGREVVALSSVTGQRIHGVAVLDSTRIVDPGIVLFALKDDLSIIWSRSFGESGDEATGMVVSDDGIVYVIGVTSSQSETENNSISQSAGGIGDGFVAAFSPEGELMWESRLGGAGLDMPTGIDCDAEGNVYVCGGTASSDFDARGVDDSVVTPDRKAASAGEGTGGISAFLVSLTGNGAVRWSLVLGGEADDDFFDVKAVATDHLIVIGNTQSRQFPLINASQRGAKRSKWRVFAASLEVSDLQTETGETR